MSSATSCLVGILLQVEETVSPLQIKATIVLSTVLSQQGSKLIQEYT